MKISRVGNYKTGFKYYKNKIEITNSEEINKIKLLKIPPAYDNVTIINNKKIIAYGYDSKYRKQVLYNPDFIAKRNIIKYKKISNSIKFFSKLKKKIAKDLRNSDEKIKAIAVIITLIFTCGFRIGNKKYEKENNSVGLTTLKYKHIKFENNKILIDFIGKKGVQNLAYCDNKKINEYLNNKYKVASSLDDYIFSYGTNKIITSNDVNEYLKIIGDYYSNEKTNTIITTKDLRTWNANMLFINYFNKLRDKEDKIEKNIKNAIEMVALKLHNTYNICKKSYIDPEIIANVVAKNK